MKTAAALFANLAIEEKLGFVCESSVNPPLVEPYDLEVSPTVIDDPIDDVQPAARNTPNPHPQDPSLEKNPGTGFEGRTQDGDLGTVLISTWKVEKKVEDGLKPVGGQSLGASRTDACEPCQ